MTNHYDDEVTRYERALAALREAARVCAECGVDLPLGGQSKPDAVQLTISADDGTTHVVTLPFTVESLARVSVEVDQ